MAADRNLLFGILALQMDLIKRDDLIRGMHGWVIEKSKPLAQILEELGLLQASDRRILEPLVARHLEVHDDDPQKSLVALSSITVLQEFKDIADPDVQANLTTSSGRGFTLNAPTGPVAGSRFRILRPHAKGGLGEVFVANDEELNREVALKEIQVLHAFDPEHRSRFLLEAEITGGLEHPGIVPVYGLGSYPDGRPYYAMRFIKGDSLLESIRRFHEKNKSDRDPHLRSLALRKLLGRFVDVCQAIAYAHSRGILHRDLKPGNVMLGKYGETLVVDWGLAKAAKGASRLVSDDSSPAEETIAHVAKTAAFPKAASAPPNQEQMLTPRSSTASQGVTQMGQAIGTPAYMSPEQAAGRLDQLGPASDVYSLGATLYHLLTGVPSIVGEDIGELLLRVQRGEIQPPRVVAPSVPLALDSVCRKAMALNPADRYASAHQLAAEIERWLADEPVKAYPEPARARLGRWGRKHPTLVVSVLVFLTVALPLLLMGTAVVNRQKEMAQRNYELAEQQRLRAEANFRLAREAVDRFDVRVSENKLLNMPRMRGLREDLLRDALEFYKTFVDQQRDTVGLEADWGLAHERLAELTKELGNQAEATALMQKAASILTDVTAAHPNDLGNRERLGVVLTRLAEFYRLTNDTKAAESAHQQAASYLKELAQEHPEVANYQSNLAASLNDLGVLYRDTTRPKLAEPLFEQAIAMFQDLEKSHPENDLYLYRLSNAHNNLGILFMDVNEPKKQEAEYLKALSLRERLVERSPNVAINLQALAQSYNNLGVFYGGRSNDDKQESYYLKAIDMRRKTVALDPDIPFPQSVLSLTIKNLGLLYLRKGKMDKAEAPLVEALAIQEKLAAAAPGARENLPTMAAVHVAIADLRERVGKYELALESASKAVDLLEPLLRDEPRHVEAIEVQSDAHRERADTLMQLRRLPEALKACDAGLVRTKGRRAQDLHLSRATVLALQGQYAEAVKEATAQLQGNPQSGQLYRGAIVYAVASTTVKEDSKAENAKPRLRDDYAARAVELLVAARDAGYFNNPARIDQMQHEHKLDAIRSRADFAAFLWSLAE